MCLFSGRLPGPVRCKGRQFDSECVDVFIAYQKENPDAGILVPGG